MEKLVEHQSMFLASILGGPASYSDDELRAVHRHLEIKQDAFDCMLILLRDSLQQEGLSATNTEVVLEEFDGRRASIIANGNGSGNRVA